MDRNKRTLKQEYNGNTKTALSSSKKPWDRAEHHGYSYDEKPMMLNAWTQTSAEDFDRVSRDDDLEAPIRRSQIEKSLLAKIKLLEENVREHTEILSEIHENYANKDISRNTKDIPKNTKDISGIHENYTSNDISKSNIESAYMDTKERKREDSNGISVYGDSVNYRIVADGAMNQNSDPIEIQLADPDAGLNSSADSGRLTICLAEDSININEEKEHNNSNDAEGVSIGKRQKTKRESLNHSMPINGGDMKCMSNNQTNCFGYETNAKNLTMRQNSNITKVHKDSPYPQEKRSLSDCVTPKMELDTVMVSIGPNNTMIPARVYENMNWSQASIATRKLLMAIFDRETLATHSMTGKPSPAFKDQMKPLKQMLNPMIIQDIIFAVTHKCNATEKEVRNAITTKCADENKMMKLQMNKKRRLRELNKENDNDFM